MWIGSRRPSSNVFSSTASLKRSGVADESSMPISSRTSRRSAASILSPGSTPPPGSAHWPGNTPRSGAMRQSSTPRSSSVTTATTISRVCSGIGSELRGLHNDRRAVAQDFGRAMQELRRVVADADDGVRSHLSGVAQHHLEGLLAGFLAKLREEGDVAAEDRLEGAADRPHDRAGPDGDSPDDTQGPRDSKAFEGEGRGRHRRVHALILRPDLLQVLDTQPGGCAFPGRLELL